MLPSSALFTVDPLPVDFHCSNTLFTVLQSLLMHIELSITAIIMFKVQATVTMVINYDCNRFIIQATVGGIQ